MPTTLLVVALLVTVPLLYKSINAYREIKVDSIDHGNSSKVAVINAEGTPELAVAPTAQSAAETDDNKRMTILLLGVDNAEGGVSRTDTIILVNVDPETKTASMLSIPRDLKVVIPGYGIDKINAAYALGEFNKVQGGGAGLMIRTIEANLGIPIAHFAQIDFQGFQSMIDTVGGITIDVPYPIKDDEYPAENHQYQRIYFPAGWQHLDGEQALIYARTRHQDGDGRRSARQQQVLLALRDKAVNMDMITKVPALIDQFAQYTRTDVSLDEALNLARLLTEINPAEIQQYSIMSAMSEEQLPDQPYYLVADWQAAGTIFSEFTGTTINPPAGAVANPDFGLPILIENGTNNDGLAGRIGDLLEANGFWNVDVALTQDGQHDQTSVVDNGGYLGTSAMLTNLIGVGADQITIPDFGATPDALLLPGATPGMTTVNGGQYAIVITLGDDAPDPAESEWQIQDYQDQVEDDAPYTVPGDGTGSSDGDGVAPIDEGIDPNALPTEDPFGGT